MPEGSPKPASVSPALFAEEHQRTNEKVARALRDYLGEPNEKNTRVLRASVRRLTTMLRIVPRRSRKKQMKQSLESGRKLLRATSKVRDVDIIEGKLSKMPRDHTIELLLNNLNEEREEYVGDSMKAAWRLFEQRKQKAERRDFRGAQGWIRRTLIELDDEVSKELPRVVRNEGKVEELHSLRKHAKTFRYALELLPSTRGSARAVEVLRSWQDVLGEIRDSDTVIEYLGRARQYRTIRDALSAERAFRHRRYRSFVSSCSRDLRSGPSLLRLAGLRREAAA